MPPDKNTFTCNMGLVYVLFLFIIKVLEINNLRHVLFAI